ncbi:MAG TPA: hypothetical protein DCE07_04295 [Peptococcaceae bacterium]|nr:hypothetical protein [Peptococcaceae bacterium]
MFLRTYHKCGKFFVFSAARKGLKIKVFSLNSVWHVSCLEEMVGGVLGGKICGRWMYVKV